MFAARRIAQASAQLRFDRFSAEFPAAGTCSVAETALHNTRMLECRRVTSPVCALRARWVWNRWKPGIFWRPFMSPIAAADRNAGDSRIALADAAKGGQLGAGGRHGHRPGRQLCRLPSDARRHGGQPDRVSGRGRARRSRRGTRPRPTASTWKGPTMSRSRASRSSACRGRASARCSTITSSSATTSATRIRSGAFSRASATTS